MHVLSVIHGTDARAGLFAPVVDLAGHTLDEWSRYLELPLER